MKHHLYIGTYTTIEHPTAGRSEGIYLYSMDDETGAVEPVAATDGIVSPSYLALSPDRRFLYAVSEVNDFGGNSSGAVYAYSVDPTSGALRYLNQRATNGAHPCHVTVDSTGKTVIVANYSGGSVIAFRVRPDGSCAADACFVQHKGSPGPNAKRQQSPHAHSAWLHPTRPIVYVLDLGMDMIRAYDLAENGDLTRNEGACTPTAPGAGPRHLDWHPNGGIAYVINELGNTIVSYSVDPETGAFHEIDGVSTLPADFADQSTTADIHVHPNGRFVYGTNRGHDSIILCHTDANGSLDPVELQSAHGEHPRNFAIDPSGRWLYIANQNSSNVVLFAIDADTGRLQRTDEYIVPAPVCLCVV